MSTGPGGAFAAGGPPKRASGAGPAASGAGPAAFRAGPGAFGAGPRGQNSTLMNAPVSWNPTRRYVRRAAVL